MTIYDQLRKWREIVKRVKEVVHRIDPSAEIYVFGSVVRGEYTGASDIDVLIITNNTKKKYEIMVRVYKEIDAPVELHVTTPEQYRKWYTKFINKDEIVRI